MSENKVKDVSFSNRIPNGVSRKLFHATMKIALDAMGEKPPIDNKFVVAYSKVMSYAKMPSSLFAVAQNMTFWEGNKEIPERYLNLNVKSSDVELIGSNILALASATVLVAVNVKDAVNNLTGDTYQGFSTLYVQFQTKPGVKGHRGPKGTSLYPTVIARKWASSHRDDPACIAFAAAIKALDFAANDAIAATAPAK